MSIRQRILAMLPWYSLGIVLTGVGVMVGVICQATLQHGLIYLWTVFVLAAVLCIIKGYVEFIGSSVVV